MRLRSPAFYVFGKENHAHTIQEDKRNACYDSDTLVTVGRISPEERPRRPFPSCRDCPYPSLGFICCSPEGNCLRTDMESINQRRRIKS